MFLEQNQIFIQDCQSRLLSLWIGSSILWMAFLLIVGINVIDIDENAPKIKLNQGLYDVSTLSHPSKYDTFSYSYQLKGKDMDLVVQSSKHYSVPSGVLEKVVLVKDRAWFDPKYYFAEFSDQKQFDPRHCLSSYQHLCVFKVEQIHHVVSIAAINHDILQTFTIMFLIFLALWILMILLILFGKNYTQEKYK